MKLLVISHKEVWKSSDLKNKYETSGGFPLQIRAISNLFSETSLICGLRKNSQLKNLTPLLGNNLFIYPLKEPPFSGFFRKISITYWLAINIKKIWSMLKYSDAVHALIPGDIGLIGLILALIMNKPIFVRHCGTWGNKNTLTDRFIYWILPKIASGKNIIMATGGGNELPERSNPNIKWIYSTSISKIEWDTLSPSSSWETGKKLRLVNVGRLSKGKNSESIIRALPKLKTKIPKLHLDLVGDGEEMKKLKELSSKLFVMDMITFHGNMSHLEVVNILCKSHLFVFPTNIREGFPKVLIEAMACGLPTIAARVSVIPHLIENKCGIILNDTTSDSILSAILDMISKPKQMSVMSGKARMISEKLTLENWQDFIGSNLNKYWGPLK